MFITKTKLIFAAYKKTESIFASKLKSIFSKQATKIESIFSK